MKPVIIVAIIIAYIVGFSAGCMFLGVLNDSEVSSIRNIIEPRDNKATGRRISPKPDRIRKEQPAPAPSHQLVRITEEKSPGQEAQVLVRTAPGQVCTIRYLNPSGQDETLPISNFQITGSDGLCGWKIPIAAGTKPGNATLFISAGGLTEEYFFKVTPGQ
jgi:hypothetical protein